MSLVTGRSGFKLHTAALSLLCVMFQVQLSVIIIIIIIIIIIVWNICHVPPYETSHIP